MRYKFSISHVPGKSLLMADALSRALCSDARREDTLLEQATTDYACQVLQSLPATERQLERIRIHQEEDEECRQAAAYSKEGWPSRQSLSGVMKHYYSIVAEISVHNGLLMRGNRIVIPASLRLEMFDRIHTGHQGISKCRERARQSIWWPGLSRQLEELVKNCSTC